MKVLLDTHTFLWLRDDDAKLSRTAHATAEDPLNRLLLSIASAWELAIKARIGKLTLPGPVGAWLPAALEESRIELLPVTLAHVAAIETLPDLHRDPFDRMLVVQAQLEGCTLLTRDAAIRAYPIPTLW